MCFFFEEEISDGEEGDIYSRGDVGDEQHEVEELDDEEVADAEELDISLDRSFSKKDVSLPDNSDIQLMERKFLLPNLSRTIPKQDLLFKSMLTDDRSNSIHVSAPKQRR